MNAIDFFDKNSGIVTLCGSTRFFTECMEANRRLTFMGWAVFACGSWGHSYHKGKDIQKTKEEFQRVKKLHFVKILLSQAIVVVSDKSMYYGDSTRAEVAFSKGYDIPIFYFDGETLTEDSENGPLGPVDRLGTLFREVDDYPGDLGF